MVKTPWEEYKKGITIDKYEIAKLEEKHAYREKT